MEEDIKLFKYDENLKEESEKIRFLFSYNVGIEKWKYELRCKLKGIEPVPQGNLSDYEYFLITNPFHKRKNRDNYYLLVNNNPVTLVKTMLDEDVVELDFTTAGKYQGKGYATKACEMVISLLFQRNDIKGIKLIDLSDHGQTTKIAMKLGFTHVYGNNSFFKENPNYVLTDGNKRGI